ncbi:MAG: hypothetical protein ACRD0Z_04740 [Acidimicrobiales bacterium]
MTKRQDGTAGGAAKRFGLLSLIAMILVALFGFFATASSAAPLLHPQTRVAAIGNADSQLVALNETVLPGGSRPRAPSYDLSATGSSVAAEGGADTQTVEQVLGNLPQGDQSFVRTVPDEAALQSTFDQLTEGGTPTTWKGYDGSVYELPDGTQIGIRSSSSSGGATIDIRFPDGSINKIHIAP